MMSPCGQSCVKRQYAQAITSIATPGTTSAMRHDESSPKPSIRPAATSSGISACVAPAPALPQPAVVAFAVPTTFGANITDVWYCVITKPAPIAPMPSRQIRNDR